MKPAQAVLRGRPQRQKKQRASGYEPQAQVTAWVKEAQAGSEDAFLALYKNFSPAVFRLLWSILRNREEAEDGTQEVFLRVHKKLSSFRQDSRFSTWVYRIAVNWAMDSKRRFLVWIRLKEKYAKEVKPGPTFQKDTNDFHLDPVWKSLTRAQRAVVVLRVVQEESVKETAAILGVSEGTVKTHLFRGLRKMRKTLNASPAFPLPNRGRGLG